MFVTLDDQTAVQEVRHSNSASLPARTVETWVRTQRRQFESAVACCTASSWAARSIVDDYGIEPSKVHVVGLGRNVNPTAGERQWFPPRFLFFGLDWKRKNGAAVVRSFARLRTALPQAHLDVAGDHPPLDVDGVCGHGRVSKDELAALYERATCFVMPSVFEPFGIAYVEAAAAGIPSIATSVGGTADSVGPGCGLIIDPHDESALLGAMRRLSDETSAAAMGAAALRRSQLFTWRKVAERLVRALRPPGTEQMDLADFLPTADLGV